jgi:hypothetical protein
LFIRRHTTGLVVGQQRGVEEELRLRVLDNRHADLHEHSLAGELGKTRAAHEHLALACPCMHDTWCAVEMLYLYCGLERVDREGVGQRNLD